MKRFIIMSLMAVCCLTTAWAQKTVVSQKQQKPEPFAVVEQMPTFTGGQEALMTYLINNLKYPADAAKQKIDGRVLVNFIVEPDGSITEAKVLKSCYPSLDAEAVRVVEAMPHWQAGRQNGKAVRVKMTLPITFRAE